MDIQRNDYVEQIASKSWNGKVKISTGIRRCGKSYLLSHLYKQYLLQQGVEKDCFVEIDLEPKRNIAYRNPNTLYDYVMSKCQDKNRKYYVFIDEIQLCYKHREFCKPPFMHWQGNLLCKTNGYTKCYPKTIC